MLNRNLSCQSSNQVSLILSVQNRGRPGLIFATIFSMLAHWQPSTVTCSLGKRTNLSVFPNKSHSLNFWPSSLLSLNAPSSVKKASFTVWCPKQTHYSTWDPTTADQNSCMRDHADYAAVCTSHYINWLFCITVLQLVHFYSLFVKSSSGDALPQWLSMLDLYSQRLSLSSHRNILIYHLLQYWPNARPQGTRRNTRSTWLYLVQTSKGWDETKTLEKAAGTWAVGLFPVNIWCLYQLWKYLKFYLGS